MNATQEDELFLKWAKGFSVTGAIYAKYSKYLQKQIKFNPIPDSYRANHPNDYDAKGGKRSRFSILNKAKDALIWAGYA